MYSTSPFSVPARQEEVGGRGEKECAWVQKKVPNKSNPNKLIYSNFTWYDVHLSPEYNIGQLREKPVDHLVLRLWCTSAANQDFSMSKINNLWPPTSWWYIWPVGPLKAQLILIQTQTSDQPFKASLLSELTNYARPALPLIPPWSNKCSSFPHYVRRGVVGGQ